jgi:hypothetical protein
MITAAGTFWGLSHTRVLKPALEGLACIDMQSKFFVQLRYFRIR